MAENADGDVQKDPLPTDFLNHLTEERLQDLLLCLVCSTCTENEETATSLSGNEEVWPMTKTEQAEIKKRRFKTIDAQLKELLPTFNNCSTDALFEKLSATKSTACGRYYEKYEFVAHCFECEADPTCIMCMRCLLRSPCRNHHIMYSASASDSGMCDCGDEYSWRKESFCAFHRQNDIDVEDPLGHLDSDERRFILDFVCNVVRIVGLGLLCWVSNYEVKVENYRVVFKDNKSSKQLPESLVSFAKIILKLSSCGTVGPRLLAEAWKKKLCIPSLGVVEARNPRKSPLSYARSPLAPLPSESKLEFGSAVLQGFSLHCILEVFFLVLSLQKSTFAYCSKIYHLLQTRETEMEGDSSDDPEEDFSGEEEESQLTREGGSGAVAEQHPERSGGMNKHYKEFLSCINASIKNCIKDGYFRSVYGEVLMKYVYHPPTLWEFFGDIQILGNGSAVNHLLRSSNIPDVLISESPPSRERNVISSYPIEGKKKHEISVWACQSSASHDNIVLRFFGLLLYQMSFPARRSDVVPNTANSIEAILKSRSGKRFLKTVKPVVGNETRNKRLPLLLLNCSGQRQNSFITSLNSLQGILTSSLLVAMIPAVSRLCLRMLVLLLRAVTRWTPLTANLESTVNSIHKVSEISVCLRFLRQSTSPVTQNIYNLAEELSNAKQPFNFRDGNSSSYWSANNSTFKKLWDATDGDFFEQTMTSRRLDDVSLPHLPTENFIMIQELSSLDDLENPFLCFSSSFFNSEIRGSKDGKPRKSIQARIDAGEISAISCSGIEYIFEVLEEIRRGLEGLYESFFSLEFIGPQESSTEDSLDDEEECDRRSSSPHEDIPTAVRTPFTSAGEGTLGRGVTVGSSSLPVLYVKKYSIRGFEAQYPLLPHGPLEQFFADILAYVVVEQTKVEKLLYRSSWGEAHQMPIPFQRIAYRQWQQHPIISTLLGFSSATSSSSTTSTNHIRLKRKIPPRIISPIEEDLLSLHFPGVPILNQYPRKYLECLLDSVVIKFVWSAQVKSNAWRGLCPRYWTELAFENCGEHYIFLLQLLAGVFSPADFSARVLERFTMPFSMRHVQVSVYEHFLWMICSIVLTPLPDSFDLNSIRERARMLAANALCSGHRLSSSTHNAVDKNFTVFGQYFSNEFSYNQIKDALNAVSVNRGEYMRLKGTEIWKQYVNLYHFTMWDLNLEDVSRNYAHFATAEEVARRLAKEKQTEDNSVTTDAIVGKAQGQTSSQILAPSSSFISKPNASFPPVEFPYKEEASHHPVWWSSRRDLLHTAPVQRVCALLILNYGAQLLDAKKDSGDKSCKFAKKDENCSEKGFLVAIHLLYLAVNDAFLISKELRKLHQNEVLGKSIWSREEFSTDRIDWIFVGKFIHNHIAQPCCSYADWEEGQLKHKGSREKEKTVELQRFLEGAIGEGKIWDWIRDTARMRLTLPQLLQQPIPEEEVKHYLFLQKKKEQESGIPHRSSIALGDVLDAIRQHYLENDSLDCFGYSSMIEYILQSTNWFSYFPTCHQELTKKINSQEDRNIKLQKLKEMRERAMRKFEKKREAVHASLGGGQLNTAESKAECRSAVKRKVENGFSPNVRRGSQEVQFIDLLLFKLKREVCCICMFGPSLSEPLFLLAAASCSNVLSKLGYGKPALSTAHLTACGHMIHLSCLEKVKNPAIFQCFLCDRRFYGVIPAPFAHGSTHIIKKSPQLRTEGMEHEGDELSSAVGRRRGNQTDKENHSQPNTTESTENIAHGPPLSLHVDPMAEKEYFFMKWRKKLPAPLSQSPASTSYTGLSDSVPLEASARSHSSADVPSSLWVPPFSCELHQWDESSGRTSFTALVNLALLSTQFLPYTEGENSNSVWRYLQKESWLELMGDAECISMCSDIKVWERLVVGFSHQIQLKVEHLMLGGKLVEKCMEILFSFLAAIPSTWISMRKNHYSTPGESIEGLNSLTYREWEEKRKDLRSGDQYFPLLIWNIITEDIKRFLRKQRGALNASVNNASTNSVLDEYPSFSPEEHIEEFTCQLLENEALKSAVEEVLRRSSLFPSLDATDSFLPPSPEEREEDSSSFFMPSGSISQELVSLWGNLACLTILKLLTTFDKTSESVVTMSWPRCSPKGLTLEKEGELVDFHFIALCNAEHLFSKVSFLHEAIVRMLYYLLSITDFPPPSSYFPCSSSTLVASASLRSSPLAAEKNSRKESRIGSAQSQEWARACLPHLRHYFKHKKSMRASNGNSATKESNGTGSAFSSLSSLYDFFTSSSAAPQHALIVPVVRFERGTHSNGTGNGNDLDKRKFSSVDPLPLSGVAVGANGTHSEPNLRDPSVGLSGVFSTPFSVVGWRNYILENILHLPRLCIDVIDHFYFRKPQRDEKFGTTSSSVPYPTICVDKCLPVRCCYCLAWVHAVHAGNNGFDLKQEVLFEHQKSAHGGVSGCFFLLHFNTIVIAELPFKDGFYSIAPYMDQFEESKRTLIRGYYSRSDSLDEAVTQAWVLNQWKRV